MISNPNNSSRWSADNRLPFSGDLFLEVCAFLSPKPRETVYVYTVQMDLGALPSAET